ncbi:MAG: endo-1,4-beta-xylanase [Bacteroidales bacterium]|nr:endo-1,4-beta-xylanase [Bacteroidales bacterium]
MKAFRFVGRSLVFTILCIQLLGCKSGQESVILPKSDALKDAADFPVGSAVGLKSLLGDTLIKELFLKHFNSVTERNQMKMRAIAPEEGKYYWGLADSLVDFSRENGLRLFGHTLIWHSSTPMWVIEKARADSAWLRQFMREYITSYVGRYKGKVDGWDVVNEGMETSGGEFRKTFWYNTLGEEYIADAFRYAHEADPDAVLFYNDFNIERDTAKLHAVIRMIKNLQKENVPIGGLGFQMHIRMDIPDETIAYALKLGAETGLQIHLSEVDVIFNRHTDEYGSGIQIYQELTDSMKLEQGEKYRNLVHMYRTIVPEEQQYGITFWGFIDKYSWIRGFFNILDWPLLFDDNLRPKPAFDGFMSGLQENLEQKP